MDPTATHDTPASFSDNASGRRSVYASLMSEIDLAIKSFSGAGKDRSTLEPRNSHGKTPNFRQPRQRNQDRAKPKAHGQISVETGHSDCFIDLLPKRRSEAANQSDGEAMPSSLRGRPCSCPPDSGQTTCSDLGPSSTTRYSHPQSQVAISCWSEDEEEISLPKTFWRRISKLKARTLEAIRDSFVLNNEEQADFQARRGLVHNHDWSDSVRPPSKRKRQSEAAKGRKRQKSMLKFTN